MVHGVLVDGQHVRLAAADFTPTPREAAMSRGGPLFARAQPPSPGSLGRFRVEFHFGGIGPEPKAHRVLAAPAPADGMIAEDSRLSPIVESVGQVQPWGALSGVTIGYAIDRHCEVTLSWGSADE